jgi:hypothetical protein
LSKNPIFEHFIQNKIYNRIKDHQKYFYLLRESEKTSPHEFPSKGKLLGTGSYGAVYANDNSSVTKIAKPEPLKQSDDYFFYLAWEFCLANVAQSKYIAKVESRSNTIYLELF